MRGITRCAQRRRWCALALPRSPPEELRTGKLIQTEVASRLAPYERLLEEAKTAIAGT